MQPSCELLLSTDLHGVPAEPARLGNLAQARSCGLVVLAGDLPDLFVEEPAAGQEITGWELRRLEATLVAAMPATTNPFPGMNPFFQQSGSDVHPTLSSLVREALSEILPPDLSARAEEHVVPTAPGETKQSYRADAAIVELWQVGLPLVASFDPSQAETGALAGAEPLVFTADGATERWVEIHDAGGDLITVTEVLSLTKKHGRVQRTYQDCQYRFRSAGAHLVEIALIRGGTPVVDVPLEKVWPHYPAGTCRLVCATCRLGEENQRWEVYLCPLKKPLPAIRVPLRWGEPDMLLALQPLVDRCYRTDRYWLSPASVQALHPPLVDAEEATWVEKRLHTAG